MKSQLKTSSEVSRTKDDSPDRSEMDQPASSLVPRQVYDAIQDQPSLEAQINLVCTYLKQSAELAQQSFQDKFQNDILALDYNDTEPR